MNVALSSFDPELAIWERVFVPDSQQLTSEQARFLLNVRFPQTDLDRINELSTKANECTLKAEERVELERYVHVGHLLSILKAKIHGRSEKTTRAS